jgi:hypothetical protein
MKPFPVLPQRTFHFFLLAAPKQLIDRSIQKDYWRLHLS